MPGSRLSCARRRRTRCPAGGARAGPWPAGLAALALRPAWQPPLPCSQSSTAPCGRAWAVLLRLSCGLVAHMAGTACFRSQAVTSGQRTHRGSKLRSSGRLQESRKKQGPSRTYYRCQVAARSASSLPCRHTAASTHRYPPCHSKRQASGSSSCTIGLPRGPAACPGRSGAGA